MPQLEYTTFVSQVFWLIVLFTAFYIFSINVSLPNLSRILKLRELQLRNTGALGPGKTASFGKINELIQREMFEITNILTAFHKDTNEYQSNILEKTNLQESNKSYLSCLVAIEAKGKAIKNIVRSVK